MPSPWKQVGVLLAMGVLVASSAAPASGADWTLRTVGDSIMLGISCPTTSRCVAGGAGNTVLSSDDPTAGASGWKSVNVGAGEQGPYYSPSRQIRAVDCPAPGFCVAVSYEGLIYTSTDPTGDAGAWTAADLSPEGPNIHMYGLDCPTANLCVAVATGGKILTSTDPAGGVGAWSVTQLPSPLYLRGISCASANLCVAVGDEGEIVSSTQPRGGAAAWSETQLPGAAIDRFLLGIACPTASLCVTGNTVNTLFTSTNPTGGAAAWTFQNVLAYTEGPKDMLNPNGMFGISCPSTALCAIAATHGQILTSTNPFDPPPAPAPTKKAKKKHRKHRGPKRPRAIIALRPPPGIEIARGKAKVRFRFFAANHASVRGYVCKLDKRHFKPCKSPKTYRLGFGKHRFTVKAVGWTGYRGKAATVGPFKVCHPTNDIYCIPR